MKSTFRAILAFGAIMSAQAAAQTQVYTDPVAFQQALAPPYYVENFDGIPVGEVIPEPWNAPGASGYGFGVATEGSGEPGLWGGAIGWPSSPSMTTYYSAPKYLKVTFTGAPVYAFGGYFASTDEYGNPIAQHWQVTLSNGFTYEHNEGGVAFRGFITTVPLAWAELVAADQPLWCWPALDHLMIGVPAVPVGACCALSGVCTLTTQASCTGTWQGGGTTCTPNPCPLPAAFVDGDFQSGNLNAWTITPTTNGQTSLQTVEVFDIDGPGPLPASNAAKFCVGQVQFQYGVPAGIALTQTLALVAGVQYQISFGYASANNRPSLNSGGIFNVIVNGQSLAQANTGDIPAYSVVYGSLTATFTPSSSGNYVVGARISRTFQPASNHVQCVDNFVISGMPPPTRACCQPNGTCVVTTQANCVSPGIWHSGWPTCSPNPCPQPQGACCQEDGSCSETTQASCSGTWQGAGSTCSSNPCPQPQGACCQESGGCSETTQTDCTSPAIWQGPGTVCDPNPCPQPTGACCFSDRTCDGVTENACTAAFGAYQGNDTTCDPNPCTGVCCLAGQCSDMTGAECAAAGGFHVSDAAGCDPNPCLGHAIFGGDDLTTPEATVFTNYSASTDDILVRSLLSEQFYLIPPGYSAWVYADGTVIGTIGFNQFVAQVAATDRPVIYEVKAVENMGQSDLPEGPYGPIHVGDWLTSCHYYRRENLHGSSMTVENFRTTEELTMDRVRPDTFYIATNHHVPWDPRFENVYGYPGIASFNYAPMDITNDQASVWSGSAFNPAAPQTGLRSAYGEAIVAQHRSTLRGDLNCDSILDIFDIPAFVLALTDAAGYAATFPDCDRILADCSGDGIVDGLDIEAFIIRLLDGGGWQSKTE